LKRVIISVSNDLSNDQRVRKIAASLQKLKLQPLLLGRWLPDSKTITDRSYPTHRWKLFFNSGAAFYAELNIRLFFKLLFSKADLLYSNDLDTLPANFLVSRIRHIPLVYDSHEYFTEVPELQGRWAKKVWLWLEARMLPKLKVAFTVSDGIASAYQSRYQLPMQVIRNLPSLEAAQDYEPNPEIQLPKVPFILLQGAGINVQRGAEELIEAMQWVDIAPLLIVGGGDVIPQLQSQCAQLKLQNKVTFIPKQSPKHLRYITRQAALGLSLDKDTNLNYRFSLPNKLFDYIQAGIPVLASDLPEVRKIIENYQVGLICPNHQPKEIASYINKMLKEDYKTLFSLNLKMASKSLVWEQQEPQFLEAIRKTL